MALKEMYNEDDDEETILPVSFIGNKNKKIKCKPNNM